MHKLLIVGAGGHARSVVDIALQNGEYELVGCINPHPGDVLGVPVIGNDGDFAGLWSKGIHHIFIAVGHSYRRHLLFNKALSLGFEPVNMVSRHAVISPWATLGKGVCVMAGAVVNVNARIGDNCIINTCCSIDHDCEIGESSHIAPGVTLSGAVKVGRIVHVGTGASVIDGISIGDSTYIGSGSVVVRDLPSNVMAYGVPARVIRKCEYQ
jgi:UDP-perosamine 4-acetyltransferase